jgi:hypothetical protein
MRSKRWLDYMRSRRSNSSRWKPLSATPHVCFGSKADPTALVRLDLLPLAPPRRMMMPSPMRGRPVLMRRVMMPMGCRCCELLPHQLPAVAVPHDLPVVHRVARADRPARKMRCQDRLAGRPVTRMGAPVLRPGGVMMRPGSVMLYAPRVTAAHVDPAVARTCAGHRREGRRQRLGFGNGRRRRLRHRLLGWRLLRPERRSERPEREGCAGKGHDTLHDIFPFPPERMPQAPQVRG